MKNLARCLTAALLCATALAAQAEDIRVLTAGAFKPVLVALQPAFEARTGHRLRIDNDTAGGIARRVAVGEAFDVVVSSPASLKDLQAAHLSRALAPQPVARVAIGVAVRAGDPQPDISSVSAFRAMLMASRRVALIDPASGGSSGIYLARLFTQWGMADAMRERSVPVMGGLVAAKVADGTADVALHQISEILAVPGVVLVGPLPAEIQNYTHYAAAASAASEGRQAVRELLAALQSPDLRRILRDKGMEAAQ